MKKRLLMLLVLLCALLVLTGCGCKHTNAHLINQTEPDCITSGYTGDTWCPDCEKIVKPGQSVSPNGEHPEYYGHGGYPATCTEDGYTGDLLCILCDAVMEQGEIIPAEGHNASIVRAAEATCTAEGYTGDAYCYRCKTTVETGEAIPKKAHVPGERVNAKESYCNAEGYTGDVYCTVCSGLIEQGEVIPMKEHVLGEEWGAQEPTCRQKGYTAARSCISCKDTIILRTELPRIDHTWGEPANAVEATCLKEGYSGDQYCTYCNELRKGSVIQRLPHNFVDNTCTACGWMTPGLYNAGQLVFTWQQLVDNGLIQTYAMDYRSRQYEGLLNFEVMAKDMEGVLVVDESIQMVGFVGETFIFGYGSFENCTGLSEVYLPCTVNFIGRLIGRNSSVEQVHCFGEITQVMDSAFLNMRSLKTFQLPEGLERIGYETFKHCESLESITIPSTVRELDGSAFYRTDSLRQIELPEGLEVIGASCFAGSGLESIVIPSTVQVMEKDIFGACPVLTFVDASQSQVTELGPYVFSCPALTYVKLPQNLQSMEATFGSAPLEILELPRGFSRLYYDINLKNLKTIVWPLSFVDKEGVLANATPETVYYEGSEIQWKTLFGDKYPEAAFVFNYDYSTPVK